MANERVLIPFKKRRHNHSHCINAAIGEAEAICMQRGVRLTEIRRRVLELVWEGHRPVKAYNILDELTRENRRAAPPTVYRALDFLLDAGLVHRIETLNAYVGCGGPRAPHVGQFLVCRKCGAVAEINDPKITQLVAKKAVALNFKVERQTVEVAGLCPDCI